MLDTTAGRLNTSEDRGTMMSFSSFFNFFFPLSVLLDVLFFPFSLFLFCKLIILLISLFSIFCSFCFLSFLLFLFRLSFPFIFYISYFVINYFLFVILL